MTVTSSNPLSAEDIRKILQGKNKPVAKANKPAKNWADRSFFAHGVNLDCTSVDEALVGFGIDWEVESVNLRSYEPENPENDGLDFFDHKGIIRADNKFPLSTVGASIYQPIQNKRCLELVEDILLDGRIIIESGGVFDFGRRVWVACRLPQEIKINFKDGKNQTIVRYIHLSWSHDQTQAVTASFVPFALERKVSLASFAPSGVPTSVSFKHTTFAHQRMNEGANIMARALKFFANAEDMFQKLASNTLSPERFNEMLNYLYPEPEEPKLNKNGGVKKSKESKTREQIRDRWEKLPSELQFTDFGAVIAISEHSDFDGRNVVRGSGEMDSSEKDAKLRERKLDSSLFGQSQKNKQRAVKCIFNFDKIKDAGGIA